MKEPAFKDIDDLIERKRLVFFGQCIQQAALDADVRYMNEHPVYLEQRRALAASGSSDVRSSAFLRGTTPENLADLADVNTSRLRWINPLYAVNRAHKLVEHLNKGRERAYTSQSVTSS